MARDLSLAALILAAGFFGACLILLDAARPGRVQPETIAREGKSDRLKAPGLDLRVFATCRSA